MNPQQKILLQKMWRDNSYLHQTIVNSLKTRCNFLSVYAVSCWLLVPFHVPPRFARQSSILLKNVVDLLLQKSTRHRHLCRVSSANHLQTVIVGYPLCITRTWLVKMTHSTYKYGGITLHSKLLNYHYIWILSLQLQTPSTILGVYGFRTPWYLEHLGYGYY